MSWVAVAAPAPRISPVTVLLMPEVWLRVTALPSPASLAVTVRVLFVLSMVTLVATAEEALPRVMVRVPDPSVVTPVSEKRLLTYWFFFASCFTTSWWEPVAAVEEAMTERMSVLLLEAVFWPYREESASELAA